MFVFKAAVVGAGGELAQAVAAAGIPVLLKGEGLERAREVSEKATAKLVEKGRLTEQAAAAEVERILALITPTDTYEGFGDVDFVIEAVEDDVARKHDVFAELDAATPGHAILATSTGELSVTEIGEVTLRPDKVVGFHPAGPRIVEIVEGDDTSPETAQAAANFAQQIAVADALRRRQGFVAPIRRSPIRSADTEGLVAGRIAAAEDPSSRGLPGARGGRRGPARRRRRRRRPARASAADEQGLERDRARRAAGDPAPAARPGPPRREGRPGLLPDPTHWSPATRRCRFERAARSRSSGSRTRPRTRSRRS